MSDIKADVGRVEPQLRNPLTTAPPANDRVQVAAKQVRAADNNGKKLKNCRMKMSSRRYQKRMPKPWKMPYPS